jgi:hypothetical protein
MLTLDSGKALDSDINPSLFIFGFNPNRIIKPNQIPNFNVPFLFPQLNPSDVCASHASSGSSNHN